MTSPTPPTLPQRETTDRLPWMLRAMAVIERAGNALPHPFWLFWILSGILAVISAILAAASVSVVSPSDGETVAVRNLLSGDGFAMAVSTMIENFATFPPMATIVVVIMGVAVAERSGFLAAVMRVGVSRVPASWVVFAVAFAGTVAHVASAAAYIILVPLGGLAFRAVGRSPILGIVVAYTSIASGYDASPVPTPNDAIFAGITTAAAKIVGGEDAYVSPLSNWFFNIASSVLLAAVITLVTKLVLSKRPDLDADPDAELDDIGGLRLSDRERAALRRATAALVVALAALVIVMVPHGSPLRGEGGSIVESPLLDGIAAVVAFLFGLVGIVYGRGTGVIGKAADVPRLMAEGIRQMAPVLVLFFAIAQFLAYFDWTRVGDVLAVRAAEALEHSGLPLVAVFLMVLVLLTLVNIMVTSGSAMWALAAPVLVPMLMLVDVPAETTQALFRIADSGSTAITPMSPYFVMALGFLQRYRKNAGIGTLASYTLPLAIAMTAAWTLLFLAWWALGIPLGPGRSCRPARPTPTASRRVATHRQGTGDARAGTRRARQPVPGKRAASR
ncbi:AbgT family transporter [Streptomyces sp. SBT349]|uniref:AbgT family transporter n=1 Tax=Streptomyces sp. SBT349 TaxID=1580539 RepID=UPI000A6E7958|nr:AbgT family transporter [Streptomyces sp. SBT349]